uniref:Transposase Tnp1/En/Spm-like domain-containing protein n=1 Tax=Nelumbo nucifera TaxID=4432 RepID=A0A822Z0A0_NELNU|nr:TPA_asm: hypothetical protein HUJ06_008554 [Nelumbo nucifera]
MQGGFVSVAKATITSLDPQKIVGGVPLGYGWTEVVINVPNISDAPLMRPYGRYRTIGTAVGVPIAWSSIHVVSALAIDHSGSRVISGCSLGSDLSSFYPSFKRGFGYHIRGYIGVSSL